MQKRLLLVMGLALAVILSAGVAQAATINSLIGGVDFTQVKADDNNREVVLDLNQNGTADVLDVGDVLEGVMRIVNLTIDVPSTSTTTPTLDGENNSQFYGHFAVEVATKTFYANLAGVDIYDFTFKAYSVFDYNSNGTMIRMYEHSPVTLSTGDEIAFDTDGVAGSIGYVSSGKGGSTATYYWSLGITDGSNAWIARAPDDPTAIGGSFGEDAQNGWFALNRTSETLSTDLGGGWDLLHLTGTAGSGEFVGSVALSPPSSTSPWDVNSTLSGTFQIAPLPTALIPGIMMFGFVVVSTVRRKRRAG
jgi:pSer/pThr/pTyr-binding forkhead associated (FHA) protein